MTLLTKAARLATGSAIALSTAVTAVADDHDHGGNFYLNPAIGVQRFDSDRDLHNEELISLGLEYRYGKHWATEINWMDSSPDGGSGTPDVDLTQYGIDGIYYFKDRSEDSKFDPYGVIGVGHAEFDSNVNTDNETQFRLGAGMRYMLSHHWSLKADARAIYGHEDDTVDKLITLGISYAFGGKSKPAMPVAPVDGDSDGDGVADSSDQCPNTPAGVAVDMKGCALDSDGDGVPDYRDNCPNTEAGRAVDEHGCKFVLKRTEEVSLNVNFASNSSVVTKDYYDEVERVAAFMKKYGAVNAVIEGHTDNTGSDSYNKSLSQRRADAVMKVLVDRFGIAASRLSATGYGEAKPIASNDSKQGRLANRRVIAVMKAEIEE